MSLPHQEQALQIARSLIDASPAHETEVTIDAVEDRFVRFADEGPTQSGDRERQDVRVRVRLGGGEAGLREASATACSLAETELQAALARAIDLAGVSAPDPNLQPLEGPVEVPETAPERPTMDHTFREKARWVQAAIESCRAEGLAPAGLIQTTAMARAIVNSAGRGVYGARTRAGFALTAGPDVGANASGGSGFAEGIVGNVERLDVKTLIKRAVDKAVLNREPQEIEPGEYTVVLEPSAASALLLFASYCGFGAQEYAEKSSFLCDRVGKRSFAEALTIYDDAANEVYPGFLFDGVGTPKERVTLIDAGTPTGPVTDSIWAQKLKLPNTGHAQPQPTTEGPAAVNLVVRPGKESTADLIAGVERGLLISQFHYTNVIEPLDLTLTGMTRNGTYLIENGEVRHPVRNMRFTETLVNAFSRITGIGRELEVAGALFDGEVVTPALRIDRFRFTSTTPF